jgi:DNA-binding response OmpR family regulator
MREYSDVPLIIVSSDKTESSRITALERGADDFILKPVSAKELIAHIQANLRRYRAPHPQEGLQQKVNGNDDKINFGKWVMDCAKYQIYDQDGNSGDLTSREFKVLKALIDNAGHAMNRDELSKVASEGNYVATPRAIDVKITRIRKKIDDNVADLQIIKTVRGVGYMFDQEKLKR